MIAYRDAGPADAEAVASLHARSWRESYRGSFTDEFLDGDLLAERLGVWRERLERAPDEQLVLLALDGARLAGFVCAYGAHDPRGRLIEIDDSPCHDDRDYAGLITAADVPGSNWQGHMVHPMAEEEILCSETITHVGQPVALALARTKAAAETAARRIRVVAEPDPEPPILTFDDIEANDSWYSFEHRDDPDDEPRERRLHRGDPAAAFAAAEADRERYAVFAGQVEVGGQSCFYLEPQAAVAHPWSQGGARIVSSTQSPAHVARYVASALGVAEHRVDVEAGFVGGGFGGKQTRSASFAAMAAVAADATERSVKLELSRPDDMTLVPGRSPFRADYRIALERDTGMITALDIDMRTNGGAGEDYSPSIAETSVFLIDNAYFIENAAIRARCGRSNLPAGFTATRGYGKPQTGALIETILDEAATALDIDPQTLRGRNLYRKGQAALADTAIDDDVLRDCWRRAVDDRYGYWRDETVAFNREHSLVKRGVAAVPSKGNMGFLEAGDINRGAAVVRLHSDGSVRVSHSGVEMGQGINTRMSQVTAQALQVPVERVAIDTTRTADLPNTPPTTMVATDMIGAAILEACDELLVTLGRHGYPDIDFDAAVRACYDDGLPLQRGGRPRSRGCGSTGSVSRAMSPTSSCGARPCPRSRSTRRPARGGSCGPTSPRTAVGRSTRCSTSARWKAGSPSGSDTPCSRR